LLSVDDGNPYFCVSAKKMAIKWQKRFLPAKNIAFCRSGGLTALKAICGNMPLPAAARQGV